MVDQTSNPAAVSGAAAETDRVGLLRVLGPVHVWALGVGIVLVGEFMGWNFSVGKGGAMGLVGYDNLTRPKGFHLREAI